MCQRSWNRVPRIGRTTSRETESIRVSDHPLDPHQEEEEEKEEEEEEDKEEKEEKEEEEEDSLDCQLWDDHSAHFFRF